VRPLTPRERKLVAVGLLALAIAALWAVVVQPLVGGFAARSAARRELLADYARDQSLIDQIPVWRAQAEAMKATDVAYAITAASQVQAQELLRQRLSATFVGQGSSAPTVEDVQADLPAGWIGARADAELTLSQLVAGIRQLESDKPYVVVEYVSINADQAFHSGHAGPLEVRLEISAPFHLAAAAPP